MLLASDRPELMIQQLLKAAFGIPEGGAAPLKGDCDHKLEFLGRLSVTTTVGLLTGSYRASVARCVVCKGYLIGKEADVGLAVAAQPAPEARPEK